MKKFFIILLTCFLFKVISAQIDIRETPVPKSGPEPKLKSAPEVKPPTKDDVLIGDEARKYGGYFSLGPSLFGFGLIGLEVRVMPIPKVAIETSITYRPSVITYQNSSGNSTSVSFYSGVATTLGPTFYFKRKMKSNNTKVLADGIFLRGGYSWGVFRESVYLIGWARERFRPSNPGRSFAVQVGGGFTHLHYSSKPIDQYGLLGVAYSPVVTAKIYWNFFPVKYKRT